MAWNGCHDLVKLNLDNPEVRDHLFEAVADWIREYHIDGLRLDAADHLDMGFMRDLGDWCRRMKPDFWLMGEVVKGPYNKWLEDGRPRLGDELRMLQRTLFQPQRRQLLRDCLLPAPPFRRIRLLPEAQVSSPSPTIMTWTGWRADLRPCPALPALLPAFHDPRDPRHILRQRIRDKGGQDGRTTGLSDRRSISPD